MTRQFWRAVLLGAALPGACLAANAAHPYANIDPRVDAGNDTGDSRVDRLNQAQLSQAPRSQYAAPGRAYAGAQQPGYPREYAPYGYAPPPGYAQPQGYPPSQAYAPQLGYPPQGYPQAYPPQEYVPQGYAPQGVAPQGYAPQGYAPQGYPPPPGY